MKPKSGNQAVIEVLDRMLAMPNEELGALIKKFATEPQHWSTTILEDLGYFQRIATENKWRERKTPWAYTGEKCPLCGNPMIANKRYIECSERDCPHLIVRSKE